MSNDHGEILERRYMTIKQLQDYYWQIKEIQALVEQIKELWNDPLVSHDHVSRGTGVSDPTRAWSNRIESLEDKLSGKKHQLESETKKVEEWVETIRDPKVSLIIRQHFLLGKTWKQTSKIVFGYATADASKMVFNRLMSEQK